MEDSSFFFKGSTLHCIKTVHRHPDIFIGKMNIFDIVFPKICCGCGREGGYICRECQKKLVKPEPICPMCCKPSIDGWTHNRCKSKYSIDRLVVGLPYKGTVQQCLKKVKYKSSWDIIKFLYKLCEFPKIDNVTVAAVPMWKQKERERGYNQAEMIAEMYARGLSGVARKVEMLERVRETRPMFGLKKNDRKENVEGAFRINHKSQILKFSNGERVILVDDVWTTGATMRECTKVLKKAGVKEVWGLTLAR